eukprot:680711-Prorocentrum_minimum.AAC.1
MKVMNAQKEWVSPGRVTGVECEGLGLLRALRLLEHACASALDRVLLKVVPADITSLEFFDRLNECGKSRMSGPQPC